MLHKALWSIIHHQWTHLNYVKVFQPQLFLTTIPLAIDHGIQTIIWTPNIFLEFSRRTIIVCVKPIKSTFLVNTPITFSAPQKTVNCQVVILTKSHKSHPGACEIVLDKLVKLWRRQKKRGWTFPSMVDNLHPCNMTEGEVSRFLTTRIEKALTCSD